VDRYYQSPDVRQHGCTNHWQALSQRKVNVDDVRLEFAEHRLKLPQASCERCPRSGTTPVQKRRRCDAPNSDTLRKLEGGSPLAAHLDDGHRTPLSRETAREATNRRLNASSTTEFTIIME